MTILDKYEKMKTIFRNMERVAIAFSGGVDSALLLKVARDALPKENVLAVLGESATYPSREYPAALAFAADLDVTVEVVKTEETDVLKFKENPPDRCYFCKTELYSKVWDIARKHQIRYIIDGTNLDDLGDFRPGHRAVAEQEVRSPLRDAEMTKAEVRALARELGLSVWDKPALACLSSRFPYGRKIEVEALKQVDAAENFLTTEGFANIRVRHYGTTARVEIGTDELPRLADGDHRLRMLAEFRKIGYRTVLLDLQGYRQGSMHETLGLAVKSTLS